MTVRFDDLPVCSGVTRRANRSYGNDGIVATWLLICCVMVFVMVVIGGVTRLTQSGLSMVEWQPLTLLPPLSAEEWRATFDNYRQYPEYIQRNAGMSLEEFKAIYWPEYIHRLWGRLIGVVFLLPFAYLLIRGHVRGELIPRLSLVFLLGAFQGFLGWFMVKSGLVDMPQVSQYRLAAHLVSALLIYAFMLWLALDLLRSSTRTPPEGVRASLRRAVLAVTGLVCVTIISGAFVAGLKAGYIYNTFPLMGTVLVPPGLFSGKPLLLDPFENPITAQFNHRLLALLVLITVIGLWWKSVRLELPFPVQAGCHILLAVTLVQVTLGVTVLLLRVPVALGAAHQAGAMLVLTVLIYILHTLRKPRTVAIPDGTR